MSENISEKILLIVGEIKGEVKGINSRLDKINGSIKDHEGKINKNENDIVASKAKATLLGAMAGIIVSVLGATIAYFKLKR